MKLEAREKGVWKLYVDRDEESKEEGLDKGSGTGRKGE